MAYKPTNYEEALGAIRVLEREVHALRDAAKCFVERTGEAIYRIEFSSPTREGIFAATVCVPHHDDPTQEAKDDVGRLVTQIVSEAFIGVTLGARTVHQIRVTDVNPIDRPTAGDDEKSAAVPS